LHELLCGLRPLLVLKVLCATYIESSYYIFEWHISEWMQDKCFRTMIVWLPLSKCSFSQYIFIEFLLCCRHKILAVQTWTEENPGPSWGFSGDGAISCSLFN
jgi:hypothetical protein